MKRSRQQLRGDVGASDVAASTAGFVGFAAADEDRIVAAAADEAGVFVHAL